MVAGVVAVAAAVLVVGCVSAAVLGRTGRSPGRAALGLRVVRARDGAPLGLRPALLRSLVVFLGSVPTFGFGVAMLAWTALMDRDREGRGWHDHLTGSVVLDVRAPEAVEEEVVERPRPVVNLTALRLIPVPTSGPPAHRGPLGPPWSPSPRCPRAGASASTPGRSSWSPA